MTEEATRAADNNEDQQQQDLRKKWAFPKKKRGGTQRIHLMSTNDTAYCGRHVVPDPTKVMDFDDWCPLDHQDTVCPRCLEWWKMIKPGQFGKKKLQAKS
nr:hypothetical protein [uncultured Methanoregula sp.]